MAIMNAGIASVKYNVTPDSLKLLPLLPLLLRIKELDPLTQPHLTILISDIHKSITFSERNEKDILAYLNNEEQCKRSQRIGGVTERYGITKPIDLFIVIELARLVPRDNLGNPLVIVNTVAPGFCKSDLLTREKAP
ncbi:NAD(P)-binding protein [Penicillium malachiteum]|uniref:NAD(P)-binding protein n=1 Tax=Penicillium malachiteum TaxID=1324776 RepID=A0AAD6MUF5_9EURO|nr:NAD(P)-binding protein [Penicillium malachiteum]